MCSSPSCSSRTPAKQDQHRRVGYGTYVEKSFCSCVYNPIRTGSERHYATTLWERMMLLVFSVGAKRPGRSSKPKIRFAAKHTVYLYIAVRTQPLPETCLTNDSRADGLGSLCDHGFDLSGLRPRHALADVLVPEGGRTRRQADTRGWTHRNTAAAQRIRTDNIPIIDDGFQGTEAEAGAAAGLRRDITPMIDNIEVLPPRLQTKPDGTTTRPTTHVCMYVQHFTQVSSK